VVPPYLTAAAGEVFIRMIQTARYGAIEPDEEVASPVVAAGGSSQPAQPDEPGNPSSRVAPNGRWLARHSGARR
jgi:hypothetical protein